VAENAANFWGVGTKGGCISQYQDLPANNEVTVGFEQAVEDGSANPLRSFAAHLTAALGHERR